MTNTEFAILSLIVELPRHGYEIEQIIEERGMREWTEIGFSSIYYVLKKLENAGLVEGKIEQQAGRGPARKVYHITSAGDEAYQTATLEALSNPHRCYAPLQLGLANLPGVPLNLALNALQQHRDALAERLNHVHNRQEAQQPLPYFVNAMCEHSLAMIATEKEWLEKFIQQLEDNNV